MDEAAIASAREAFDRYERALAGVLHESRHAVVRWRGATEAMVGWRPYFDQVERAPDRWLVQKRRWLDDPKPADEVVQHGLDASGVVRVIRSACDVETHVVQEDDRVDGLTVRVRDGERPRLQTLERFILDGGMAHTVYTVGPGSLHEARYQRENERWAAATMRRIVEGEQGGAPRYYGERDEESYRVDATGRLQSAVHRHYDRTGACTSHDVLFVDVRDLEADAVADDIVRQLVEAIPAIAKRAEITPRCRALLLCYCGEDLVDTYPGFFFVFVPQDVADQLEREGRAYAAWEPDELRQLPGVVEIGVHDPRWLADIDLLEKCDAFARLCELEAEPDNERIFARLVAPLRSIAWRLNSIDWSGLLRVTPDFVVIARDNTLVIDLERDSEGSVPPDRRARVPIEG